MKSKEANNVFFRSFFLEANVRFSHSLTKETSAMQAKDFMKVAEIIGEIIAYELQTSQLLRSCTT